MNKKEYNSEHNVYTTINIQDSTPALGHSILKISRAASDSIYTHIPPVTNIKCKKHPKAP